MVELRDYQRELLHRVQQSLERRGAARRIMLQLPTGGGKTRIAGELLVGRLKDGCQAVWLTHRKELADQTAKMLREHGVPAMADIRWEPGSAAPSMANGAVILMAQTVTRRNVRDSVWNRYGPCDLMIIDEAHHAAADGYARAIRHWQGPVLGMTATPWRLSEGQGFGHLFDQLHCGPQVTELQASGWLCRSHVIPAPQNQQILSGDVDRTGDFSEGGIEQANRGRDVWTAGALRFWEKHGEDRQTVVYAVSVRHARNLRDVFIDGGVRAEVLLGDTPNNQRAQFIEQFRNCDIRVLVNVAVATEGFDLPDAGCVLMTRPTMSLALYLQMVGRGLRPKPDSGGCVILDMAGNSLRHGLPEADRQWSLEPRGTQPPGEGPTIRCPRCEHVSHAGNHACPECGEHFGQTCGRCGAWRAWKRWSWEHACGDDHDLVCDRCHHDAHLQAQLPVTEDLMRLAKPQDDDECGCPPAPDEMESNPFIRNLLKQARHSVSGPTKERRRRVLRSRIEEHEALDDEALEQLFQEHLDTLPEEERPANRIQWAWLFVAWERERDQELEQWRGDLQALEAEPVDVRQIYDHAKAQLLQLFETEARNEGLLPPPPPDGPLPGDWVALSQYDPPAHSPPPSAIRFPGGQEENIGFWNQLPMRVIAWLRTDGRLRDDAATPGYLTQSRDHARGFINARRIDDTPWICEANGSAKAHRDRSRELLRRFDVESGEVFVQPRQD